MLGNQNRLLVSGKLGNDVGCLSLECGHKFCSHLVILKCHFRSRNHYSWLPSRYGTGYRERHSVKGLRVVVKKVGDGFTDQGSSGAFLRSADSIA